MLMKEMLLNYPGPERYSNQPVVQLVRPIRDVTTSTNRRFQARQLSPIQTARGSLRATSEIVKELQIHRKRITLSGPEHFFHPWREQVPPRAELETRFSEPFLAVVTGVLA